MRSRIRCDALAYWSPATTTLPYAGAGNTETDKGCEKPGR